jgi:hypothetical protein
MKRQIKGITLQRPWGYAVTHLGKDIENRTWECDLDRGDFLVIHNGKKWDKDGELFIRQENRTELISNPDEELCPPGAIIGLVTFLGNLYQSDSPWFAGPVGWQIVNPVSIPPIPYKGQLGLWDIDSQTLNIIRHHYQAHAERMKLGISE